MRILTLLATAVLLAPAAHAQKINDIILKKDGSRVRGVEVKEFLLTGVRGTRGTDPFELPAHQVAAIEWSEPPEAFLAGRAAMDRGDFQTATQLFGSVASDRALVKTDAEFFMIKAAVSAIGADKTAAATAAQKARQWLDANPGHWRSPEAMLLTGRAERLAGTGGQAATTLRELDDKAVREGLGAIWSARAKYELAQTLLSDGKAGEARTQFQAASAEADNAMLSEDADKAELTKLKTLSRVGEGEAYLVDKDFSGAESYFRRLADSGEAALVAAGHAGAGEAVFLASVGTNDIDGLRRAQMSLARGSVLDVTSGEASAKANYYLGRCLLALGADREGENFRQRAQAYFEVVYTAYPETQWAGLARIEAAK